MNTETKPPGTTWYGVLGTLVPVSSERLSAQDCAPLARVVDTIARTVEGDLDRMGSSTDQALQSGGHSWAKKIVEEAYELGCALEFESDARIVEEAQQLIYRILVGVMGRGVHARDVLAAL